jgi:hypothetical protein
MACFPTKNPNLGKYWGGLAMEDFCLFYGHLVYFLRPFDVFNGYLVNSVPFWYVVPRKIWQP